METVNTTSLRPHFAELVRGLGEASDDPVDLVLVQEHSLPTRAVPGLKGAASKQGCKLVASACDPTTAKPTGGVACLAAKHSHLVQITPKTKEFTGYHREGRVMLALCSPGIGVPLLIVNVYAWTNALKKKDSMAASQALFVSIFLELESHPPLPVIVAGDFNLP
eukprot:5966220-Alexandrium_andersonii.AAC.1